MSQPEYPAGPLGEGISYFTPNLSQYTGSGPTPYGSMSIPCGTIQLEANVQYTVNLINAGQIIPYGDFGGSTVYWFQTFENALGNIVYTVFDRDTTLGLASFMVRFGAAATIGQILSQSSGKSELPLQLMILPRVPFPTPVNGSVTP
jgi:hypothetical protein